MKQFFVAVLRWALLKFAYYLEIRKQKEKRDKLMPFER